MQTDLSLATARQICQEHQYLCGAAEEVEHIKGIVEKVAAVPAGSIDEHLFLISYREHADEFEALTHCPGVTQFKVCLIIRTEKGVYLKDMKG